MQVIDSFRDEHFFLSNFSPSPIVVSMNLALDGNPSEHQFTLATGEHCFQAMKLSASTMDDAEKHRWMKAMEGAATPGRSKYLGRSIRIDIHKWNAIAYRCMERTQELKYTQNIDLQEKLLATGDAKLIEGTSWGDKLWGVDEKGEGKNQLGIILMALRSKLQTA